MIELQISKKAQKDQKMKRIQTIMNKSQKKMNLTLPRWILMLKI